MDSPIEAKFTTALESLPRVELNSLSARSPWPARLLGLEPWGQRVKSRDEIDREYEREQWGVYLERIESERLVDSILASEIDNWQCSPSRPLVYSCGNNLYDWQFGPAYQHLINVLCGIVEQYLPSQTIVELGCGYGSVILPLASRWRNDGIKWVAAEYTPSGQALTKICAHNAGVKLVVGACDFLQPKLTDIEFASDAIIFTSSAVCNVPVLSDSFLTAMINLKPKCVIHFEPIYEHQVSGSLLSLMRRRYIEINDQNRNLLSLLRERQINGELKILEEHENVIGINPLFPLSVIVWKPSNAR